MIRRYIGHDIPMMLEKVEDFLEATGNYNNVHYNREKVKSMLNFNLTNTRFFCNVAVVEDVVVGGLCATVGEYPFSKEIFAQDLLFYVEENRRGLRLATDLVEGYVEWAKKRGARECRLANSTGIKPEAYGKLCEQFGFSYLGPIYQMRF